MALPANPYETDEEREIREEAQRQARAGLAAGSMPDLEALSGVGDPGVVQLEEQRIDVPWRGPPPNPYPDGPPPVPGFARFAREFGEGPPVSRPPDPEPEPIELPEETIRSALPAREPAVRTPPVQKALAGLIPIDQDPRYRSQRRRASIGAAFAGLGEALALGLGGAPRSGAAQRVLDSSMQPYMIERADRERAYADARRQRGEATAAEERRLQRTAQETERARVAGLQERAEGRTIARERREVDAATAESDLESRLRSPSSQESQRAQSTLASLYNLPDDVFQTFSASELARGQPTAVRIERLFGRTPETPQERRELETERRAFFAGIGRQDLAHVQPGQGRRGGAAPPPSAPPTASGSNDPLASLPRGDVRVVAEAIVAANPDYTPEDAIAEAQAMDPRELRDAARAARQRLIAPPEGVVRRRSTTSGEPIPGYRLREGVAPPTPQIQNQAATAVAVHERLQGQIRRMIQLQRSLSASDRVQALAGVRTPAMAEAMATHTAISDSLRELGNTGVPSEAEIARVNEIAPRPDSLGSWVNSDAAYAGLSASVRRRTSDQMRGWGYDPVGGGQQQGTRIRRVSDGRTGTLAPGRPVPAGWEEIR